MATPTLVFGSLLMYSIAMFSLPIFTYFGARQALKKYTEFDDFINTVVSVVAALLIVYAIIAMYVIRAYRELENEVAERVASDKDKDSEEKNKTE